jgi:hypothetical protein
MASASPVLGSALAADPADGAAAEVGAVAGAGAAGAGAAGAAGAGAGAFAGALTWVHAAAGFAECVEIAANACPCAVRGPPFAALTWQAPQAAPVAVVYAGSARADTAETTKATVTSAVVAKMVAYLGRIVVLLSWSTCCQSRLPLKEIGLGLAAPISRREVTRAGRATGIRAGLVRMPGLKEGEAHATWNIVQEAYLTGPQSASGGGPLLRGLGVPTPRLSCATLPSRRAP